MDLLKKQVYHRVFGRGNIVDLSGHFVEIQFPKGNKKFVFPDAFGTYLVLSDEKAAKAVMKMKEKKLIELEKEEIRNAKERVAQLKEQIWMRNERLIKNLKFHPSAQAVFWCREEDLPMVFEDWNVSTGVVKTGENKGRTNRPARLHQNSACLLTVRNPKEPEQNRRILGAFMVNTGFVGKACEDGIIPAHEEYRIQLTEEEADTMSFWNYYVNEKSPKNMTWNTGKYRYFDNIMMAQILRDIVTLKKKASEKETAQRFFNHFCMINRIDKVALPKPNGSLMRV